MWELCDDLVDVPLWVVDLLELVSSLRPVPMLQPRCVEIREVPESTIIDGFIRFDGGRRRRTANRAESTLDRLADKLNDDDDDIVEAPDPEPPDCAGVIDDEQACHADEREPAIDPSKIEDDIDEPSEDVSESEVHSAGDLGDMNDIMEDEVADEGVDAGAENIDERPDKVAIFYCLCAVRVDCSPASISMIGTSCDYESKKKPSCCHILGLVVVV